MHVLESNISVHVCNDWNLRLSVNTSHEKLNLLAVISKVFHYDSNANVTFDMWFPRYKDLFKFGFADQDDAWKARSLLWKLSSSEIGTPI